MKLTVAKIGTLLGMSKPRRKFLAILFNTLVVVRGKANFTNMSRYAGISERTLRRNFRVATDWVGYNFALLGLLPLGDCIAALDCTATAKAGKKTWGLGRFWSGSHNQSIRGLEVSCIAIVSQRFKTAFTLSARQTDGRVKDTSRMAGYLQQVLDCADQLKSMVNYIVGDGFYSKRDFVDGIRGTGLHFIGRLRGDADMRYLYKGRQAGGRGPRRKYAGKFTVIDRRRWKLAGEIEEGGLQVYYAVMNHRSLKRDITVAMLLDVAKGKHVLLFSTDTELEPMALVQYYRSRFQIEFLFRDAKQHFGFKDCQARGQRELDFHFNASLTAVSLVKADLHSQGRLKHGLPISIADYKTEKFNEAYLLRIIEWLGISPNSQLIRKNYQDILNWGRRAA